LVPLRRSQNGSIAPIIDTDDASYVTGQVISVNGGMI